MAALPVFSSLRHLRAEISDRGHRFRLGGGAEGVGLFEVGGADEEDVTFLLTLERFHGVYVADKTFALRGNVESFKQGCRYEPFIVTSE